MDKNEVMSIAQLPIIHEQLAIIKNEVSEKVATALSLVCTEETVAEVKALRATLNGEFKEWEEKRKEVKTAIMQPYEDFEAAYKDCISNVYKQADATLKERINSVEGELKAAKEAEVRAYFDELCIYAGIDFVSFEKANISVTLSVSNKKLREQAKAFVDHICEDLILIKSQEYKDEILYEYKQSLNVSNAVTKVVNRHKALDAEKERAAELAEKETSQVAATKRVDEALAEEAFTAPAVIAPVEEGKIYTTTFTVKGTKTKLKVLKEFLDNGGYEYE